MDYKISVPKICFCIFSPDVGGMDYLVKKMWQEAREFRKHFGVRPGKVFIVMKVENILEYMATYPEEKNYCISLEFGFANEKALYKFLKRHTQKNSHPS